MGCTNLGTGFSLFLYFGLGWQKIKQKGYIEVGFVEVYFDILNMVLIR